MPRPDGFSKPAGGLRTDESSGALSFSRVSRKARNRKYELVTPDQAHMGPEKAPSLPPTLSRSWSAVPLGSCARPTHVP